MQQDFYDLADFLNTLLQPGEVHLTTFRGEVSDFVRFNKSAIRQPGRVTQRYLNVDLVLGMRHAAGTISLAGDPETDRAKTAELVSRLRSNLPLFAEDPHLLYATEVHSRERHQENRLPSPNQAMEAILEAGKERDLVGIYASGGIHAGFANSLGQRNWFSTYSFNFDWSFYHSGDKAVKSVYAGFEWDPAAFRAKVDTAAEQLSVLSRKPRTVPPGHYRVYLSPTAVAEIIGMLGWGGFGLKDNRTKQSPLLRLITGEAKLHPSVSILENTAGGVAPDFQDQGFLKPDKVVLIENGRYKDPLVSPRSAKEYGVATNGASPYETPESVEMLPGSVPTARALEKLGTGVWIGNLWYLNYSDRPGCRLTGMTRFATFWVENGVIQAPLSVMRFDETVYRMFGEKLVGLTDEAEMILDSTTYGARSVGSVKLPGALIEDFTFTL